MIEVAALSGSLSFGVGCVAMFCMLKACDHLKTTTDSKLQQSEEYQGQELQETMDDSFEERETRYGSSMKKLSRFVSPLETDRNMSLQQTKA